MVYVKQTNPPTPLKKKKKNTKQQTTKAEQKPKAPQIKTTIAERPNN